MKLITGRLIFNPADAEIDLQFYSTPQLRVEVDGHQWALAFRADPKSLLSSKFTKPEFFRPTFADLRRRLGKAYDDRQLYLSEAKHSTVMVSDDYPLWDGMVFFSSYAISI